MYSSYTVPAYSASESVWFEHVENVAAPLTAAQAIQGVPRDSQYLSVSGG